MSQNTGNTGQGHHHMLVSTGRGGAGNMIEAKVSAATSVGTKSSAVNSDGELVIEGGVGGGGSSAANEVILTEEEWEQYMRGKGKGKGKVKKMRRGSGSVSKIDEDTDGEAVGIMEHPVFASSGRGGVGNMTKTARAPSAHVIHEDEENKNELSPVFSTGRGGAGNIYTTLSRGKAGKNEKGKVKVKAPRIEDELSPIHSGIGYRNETGGIEDVDVVLDVENTGNDKKSSNGKRGGRGGVLGKLKGLFR